MDINELQAMKLTDLRDVARELEVTGYSTMRKQDLIFEILRVRVQAQGHGFRGGVRRL
jgi:transcription termination factor Rho